MKYLLYIVGIIYIVLQLFLRDMCDLMNNKSHQMYDDKFGLQDFFKFLNYSNEKSAD